MFIFLNYRKCTKGKLVIDPPDIGDPPTDLDTTTDDNGNMAY